MPVATQGGGKKKGTEGGIGAAVSPHTQSALRRTLTRMETSLSGAQPNRWGASYPTQLKVLRRLCSTLTLTLTGNLTTILDVSPPFILS